MFFVAVYRLAAYKQHAWASHVDYERICTRGFKLEGVSS